MDNEHKTKIKGKIVRGSGDGKRIGFPTINVDYLGLPEIVNGVYSCYVMIDGIRYKGVMHFGPRLVFNETNVLCEVHLFDFNSEVYEKFAEIETVKFLRPTMDFGNVQDMIAQIEKDCTDARATLE